MPVGSLEGFSPHEGAVHAVARLRRASLIALAEALDAASLPAAEVGAARAEAALARAVELGALAGRPDGVLTPTVRVAAAVLPSRLRQWAARGFLPFRSKPLICPGNRRETVRRLIGAAVAIPELCCVPHWVVGGRVLTLQLPGAADLRHALVASATAGREWVHEVCLRSLREFASRDASLRAALADGRCGSPAPFPVAERFLAARTHLARTLGPVDLPATLPASRSPGPVTLFCDPKPANFLLPRAMVVRGEAAAAGAAGGWPVRVDLDLLRFTCPVSLQLVIALYAHPIALPVRGPGGTGFAGLLHDACHAGLSFGVEPAETEAMVLYHLVRNFASAAQDASPAGARKAVALAAVLREAVTSLPSIPSAPGTASLLTSWLSANTKHRRHA